jgi:hypothetical protein
VSAPARGGDDDYCSAYPPEGHHYVSHSVNAHPIRWVERCSLCGHLSGAALREQIGWRGFSLRHWWRDR